MENSILKITISGFDNYRSTEPKGVTLLVFLTNDRYANDIAKLRQEPDKKKRDAIKATLPCITPSGVFSKRSEAGLIIHSGFIQFDIDAKDNPAYFDGLETLEDYLTLCAEIKAELAKLGYVAYIGLSASGRGLWGLIPITEPGEHKAHFAAIAEDFAEMGIVIDKAPSNVASLRGYSYDPDAYFNHSAEKYSRKVYPAQKERTERPQYRNDRPTNTGPMSDERKKTEFIINEISKQRIDITNGYRPWFSIGCALANEFGEAGRDCFHDISQFHPDYDFAKTDKQFDHCLKGRGGFTIATFYDIAATYGILYKDGLTAKSERREPLQPKATTKPKNQPNPPAQVSPIFTLEKTTDYDLLYDDDIERLDWETIVVRLDWHGLTIDHTLSLPAGWLINTNGSICHGKLKSDGYLTYRLFDNYQSINDCRTPFERALWRYEFGRALESGEIDINGQYQF